MFLVTSFLVVQLEKLPLSLWLFSQKKGPSLSQDAEIEGAFLNAGILTEAPDVG